MTDDTSRQAPQTAHPGKKPLDRLFAVLSDPYRRRILSELAETDPRTGHAFSPDEFTGHGEGRAATELYHVHLPLLEAADYIEWDRTTNTIRHGPDYEEIAPVLDVLNTHLEAFPGDWR